METLKETLEEKFKEVNLINADAINENTVNKSLSHFSKRQKKSINDIIKKRYDMLENLI